MTRGQWFAALLLVGYFVVWPVAAGVYDGIREALREIREEAENDEV